MVIRFWLLIVFCSFLFFDAGAQGNKSNSLLNTGKDYQPDIIFSHLTEKEGLSYNVITGMLGDKDGYLWISTQYGLNRYDGKHFEVFLHDRLQANSIIQNFITAICETSDGNIWGSSWNGIFCYDKVNSQFKNYVPKKGTSNAGFQSIVAGDDGSLWIGSFLGLLKFDPKQEHFDVFQYEAESVWSISNNKISKNSICKDPNGQGLWIATANGLNWFDPDSGNFTNYRNEKSGSIFNDHFISALHVSREGMIWFFDNQTKEIIGFKQASEGPLYRIYVGDKMNKPYAGFLFETSSNELWYSSSNYETARIEYLNHNKIEIVKNDLKDPLSIAGDFMGAAWEDKDNTLWLGTNVGISRYNKSKNFYRTLKLADRYPELNHHSQITCIKENPNTLEWWIGSSNSTIYILNPLNGKTKHIDLTTFYRDTNAVITDFIFLNDIAVISAAGKQTLQYHQILQKIEPFKILSGEYSSFTARVIVQETDSTYLFSNNLYTILRWNTKTNTLVEVKFEKPLNKQGNKHYVGWLTSYKGKGSWLTADNHTVGYIHPGDSIIKTLSLPISNAVHKGGYFQSPITDKDGNLWFIMTTQGLYKVLKKVDHPKQNQDIELLHWNSSDGLTIDNVQTMTISSEGLAWCTVFNRFSVFDPIKQSFFNFKVNLSENNQNYYNYIISLTNGNILVNIKGNLVEFFPKKLIASYPKNDLIISAISLPTRKILISNQNQIELQHKENFLTIYFGNISVREFFPYKILYQLEGVNEQWIEHTGKFEASYTSLAPGKYTFKVKAVSIDKSWESAEKKLILIINAPFHKQWWFIWIVLFIIFGSVGYVIVSRIQQIRNINSLKSKAQLLEKEKTTVMYENLKQHLNPHFLFNSLTSLSSLIRIDPKQAGDFLDKMSKVYRYILRNKDNETVPLFEELNFVELYIQLQKTRFEDGLQVDIQISEDYLTARIVPVTLQNLIENAIKHNTADADQPLKIKLFIEKDYLIVSNTLQRKNYVETSNKQGQNSMVSLYRFLSPKPIIIEESTAEYIVKIPLI
jgi:ligand-binding sensor domain-containing protein